MGKILTFTIILIVLLASAHAINLKEVVQEKTESTSILTIGEHGDFQLFGFSFRGLIFRVMKLWLKGYIAGYEGRYSVPAECFDQEFQDHVSKRGWEAFTTLLTFWRYSREIIENRIIMFAVVVADEVMNDCGDGQILVDLFNLYTSAGSIFKFVLRLAFHALYTSPFLIFWGVISTICNLIFFYWGGGYGAGQFLNAVVVGVSWPWDG